MSAAAAFHALREIALAGVITPADRLAVYDALAEIARAADLPAESLAAEVIAAGLRGEETMELLFNELSQGGRK